ncbi:MAG: hypothetical protein KIS61_22150, partial [Candidatus Eremiobacteraeota bacterium]|nr:hypothetical protein [Candidatus Eremiobacteraeota bacterium]
SICLRRDRSANALVRVADPHGRATVFQFGDILGFVVHGFSSVDLILGSTKQGLGHRVLLKLREGAAYWLFTRLAAFHSASQTHAQRFVSGC